MLFTRLIEYKVRKEEAKPSLIVAHYTDFAEDKNVRPALVSLFCRHLTSNGYCRLY